MKKSNQIVMLLAMIGRGKGKEYIDMMNARGLRYHLQSAGHGTAPSEMMDIFGLGTNDKDVIFSYAPYDCVETLAGELGRLTGAPTTNFGGLLVIMSLSAINRLSAELIYRSSEGAANKGVRTEMNKDNKYHMIFVCANEGYVDEIMKTARGAGATGGTVIRGRLADIEKLEQFGGMDKQEEKEVLMILASTKTSKQILEVINREWGAKSDAQSVVCALPVEEAFKI